MKEQKVTISKTKLAKYQGREQSGERVEKMWNIFKIEFDKKNIFHSKCTNVIVFFSNIFLHSPKKNWNEKKLWEKIIIDSYREQGKGKRSEPKGK